MIDSIEALRVEVVKQRAEIDQLTTLLKRHDDLCRKDEAVGNDYVWTPALRELVADTRVALRKKP